MGDSRQTRGGLHAIALSLMTEAQRRTWEHALHVCSPFSLERRQSAVTGAQAAAELLKVEENHIYGPRTHAQVPFISDRVVEPTNDITVDLLEVLPAEEAAFYSSEENVVDWSGKTEEMLAEINRRFGFLGGSEEGWSK